MNEVLNQAIAHITQQAVAADDPLITMIEEHLTSICTTEEIASKLLYPQKTIKECSDRIWDRAKKIKKGNSAHIPDAECCRMAEDYYGITEDDKVARKKVGASNFPAVEAGQTINILDWI